MRKIARPELLSEINKMQILNLLRTNGPASRAELSRALCVSFPTISANVKSLMAAGLIVESGEGNNELGRKSRLLQYNARRGYIIGGDIGRKSARIFLADLAGNCLHEAAIQLDEGRFTDKILQELDKRIDLMLLKEGIGVQHVLTVCIGVPYRIDSTSRANYLNIPSERTEQVRLDQYFSSKFHTSVQVENSIYLGLLGEKTYGIGKNFHNIFYIDFGVGLGSSLMLNGQLFCGANGAAGEIAYCIPDTQRLRSAYNDNGLLEELIASAAKAAGLKADENGHIQEMKPAFLRARQNDPAAIAFLDQLANYLGILLVNSVALLNPEVVVFAGSVGTHLLERYYTTFLRMLSAHVPIVPQLLPSSLGKRGSGLGAVSEAVERLHKDYAVLEAALHKLPPAKPTLEQTERMRV